jgi:hypothetical protein
VRAFLLVLLFRVAIAAVTILSIHKRLHTPKCATTRKEAARLWRLDGPCLPQAGCLRQAG